MRDVVITNIGDSKIAVSTDNSGGIGVKELDIIKVSYETTSYYSARVALMENMSIGAYPNVISISNFCGENAWQSIIEGVKKATKELNLNPNIIGSTESNFSMMQSAIGITVIGEINKIRKNKNNTSKYAVIGKPLLGNEVISNKNSMVLLSEFLDLLEEKKVYEILPVGSKGIKREFEHFNIENIQCSLDIKKSAGPSTCVIVSYDKEIESWLKNKFQNKFYEVKVWEK